MKNVRPRGSNYRRRIRPGLSAFRLVPTKSLFISYPGEGSLPPYKKASLVLCALLTSTKGRIVLHHNICWPFPKDVNLLLPSLCLTLVSEDVLKLLFLSKSLELTVTHS